MPGLSAPMAQDTTRSRPDVDTARSGLAGWLARCLPPGWFLLRDGHGRAETLLATDGRLELRQVPGGVVALTAVKGTAAAALQTGLRRLDDYVAGQNGPNVAVKAAHPVVLRPASHGRWFVEIGLAGLADAAAAPAPRNRKVRIRAAAPETVAIMRIPRYLPQQGVARAEDEIHAILARRGWRTTGPAMLRLRSPLALLPLLGRCELALPVELAA